MSKSAKDRPRLGRGLSSLIPSGDFMAGSDGADPADPIATIHRAVPPRDPATQTPTRVATPLPIPAGATAATPAIGAPAAGSAAQRAGTMEIPVDQITPNPHQPRRQFNEQALAELAASIKSTGLIQPIVVRAAGTGYEIIAGERRWRAARIAGLTSIPALVRAVDRFTQAQIALVENIQREDLNPMDRARAYQDVIALVGLTQGELAGRLGVERSGIANHLRLLMLPRPVQAMVADGSLSVGHAKVLAGVSDQVEQERYAQLVLSQGLSVRNLERAIESDNPASAPAAASAATSAHPATGSAAHLPDLEQALTRQLGLRVQVRAGKVKGRGRLILHYATLDEFDGLMTRMGVRIED